jgi:hypothetical protein
MLVATSNNHHNFPIHIPMAISTQSPIQQSILENVLETSNHDYQQPQMTINRYKQGSYNQQQSFQSSDTSSVNGNSFDQSYAYTASHLSSYASGDQPYHSTMAPVSDSAHNVQEATNVPVCPTHNQLCRLLTARSEANAGRQFYKCSVVDHQQACDFFQWADGNDANWNNNENRDWAPPGGDVLDHHVENRRKFGHSSFRPGQQEVIENALKGRDVFVLMPTGEESRYVISYLLGAVQVCR